MKVFDQNDLTKAAFEPVLLTPLQRAQKDGYVNIIGAEGKKKIEYITLEKHVENYEDPEEKVRANFFAELIYKYEYPANRIKVEVIVPDRLPLQQEAQRGYQKGRQRQLRKHQCAPRYGGEGGIDRVFG